MAGFGFICLLVSVVLFAVAVLVHYRTSSLSLPISPIVSIITVILPIAGFLNAYMHPSLLYTAHRSNSRITRLTPFIIQTLQALVATILATLFFEAADVFGSSPTTGCLLENEWMQMFRAHDGASIRDIQDRFDCCGFNSVKDRAYPFGGSGAASCAQTFDRSQSCRASWTTALRTNAGINFGIVVAVGVLQFLGLLIMTDRTRWWRMMQERNRRYKEDHAEDIDRPLLTAVEEDEEECIESQDGPHTGYGAITSRDHENDDDNDNDHERDNGNGQGNGNGNVKMITNANDDENQNQNRRGSGSGTVARVTPLSLYERNVWSEETTTPVKDTTTKDMPLTPTTPATPATTNKTGRERERERGKDRYTPRGKRLSVGSRDHRRST